MNASSTNAMSYIRAAAVLLFIVALIHLSGFLGLPKAPEVINASSFHTIALQPLWLFASIQWIMIAAICEYSIRLNTGSARTLLAICVTVLFLNAALLFAYLGPFVGAFALSAVTGLLVIGIVRIGRVPPLPSHQLH